MFYESFKLARMRLQELIDEGHEGLRLLLQTIEHTLDFELFGEPVIAPLLRRHRAAEHATSEFIPQQPTMTHICGPQRDLTIWEVVVVGETSDFEGMNQLVDEVWEPLRLNYEAIGCGADQVLQVGRHPYYGPHPRKNCRRRRK